MVSSNGRSHVMSHENPLFRVTQSTVRCVREVGDGDNRRYYDSAWGDGCVEGEEGRRKETGENRAQVLLSANSRARHTETPVERVTH